MEKRHLSDVNSVFFKACPPSVMDVMCRFGLGIPLTSAESAVKEYHCCSVLCCTVSIFFYMIAVFVCFFKMNLMLVQTLVFLFMVKGIPALSNHSVHHCSGFC